MTATPTAPTRRASLRLAVLSALLAAPLAHADVIPFVDNYKTNQSSNTTLETNAALALLSGYNTLWTIGLAWNTGAPTPDGLAVLHANEHYVVEKTTHLTPDQLESAYFTDRRNQSYTATSGLGALTDAYRTAAGATTTITTVAPNADIALYNDEGTGWGNTSSPTVGQIVSLVATLRGNYSSTTPAKNHFLYPRPWRLTDDNSVVTLGTEPTGYYTSDLSNGTPNYSAGLTYFPLYQTSVVIPPTLRAVRSTNPATDSGFISGHTNAGYLSGFAMAYAMPAYFQQLLLEDSNIGEDRIAAGMHSPLDVVGGRMLATALSAAILSDPANAPLKAAAYAQGTAFLTANATAASGDNDLASSSVAQHRQEKRRFTFRLTYGLPRTDPTNLPAVVPQGAEVLLETRQPYLTADQRREVLRTTAIDSGNALTDDAEGWGRLNLYAAADGYGALESDVTVTMDASAGGFSARDVWRNDIGGTGSLTKEGTGELDLTGENTFRGGLRLNNGVIVAASPRALGKGPLVVTGGTLIDSAPAPLHIDGDYTQSPGGTLQLNIEQRPDTPDAPTGAITVHGNLNLAGPLHINLTSPMLGAAPKPAAAPMLGATPQPHAIPVIRFTGSRTGSFTNVIVSGLQGAYSLEYGPNVIILHPTRPADHTAP